MLTLVSAEVVQELEVAPKIDQVETLLWHYYVPCAGVRYYSFEPILSTVEESDPWALDELTTRI